MLSVLLTVLSVLKIIGIVLLCILGFILLLLLLVLFVPIRYRADVLIPETDLEEGFDAQKMDVSAKFSWLLFVIRGGISFPKDKAFTLRIFGIKILPKKQKEGDEKPAKKKKKKGKDKEEAQIADESGKEDSPGDEAAAESAESSESGTEVAPAGETNEAQAEGTEETGSEGGEGSFGAEQDVVSEEDDDEKSFLDVLWKIIDGIDNFLKTPLNVLEKIQYTISRVCDKIDMIKSTLENDIFKRAFALVKNKLIKILKMILPDKCKIDVLFGSGDPATTAEIMGAYSALYPVLFKKVKYRPDFERKVIFTDAHIKGHITLFTIVYSVAVCYFNKDVKKTIKRIKKILES